MTFCVLSSLNKRILYCIVFPVGKLLTGIGLPTKPFVTFIYERQVYVTLTKTQLIQIEKKNEITANKGIF